MSWSGNTLDEINLLGDSYMLYAMKITSAQKKVPADNWPLQPPPKRIEAWEK